MLDYYKQEGGEKNILETFKKYHLKMLTEEKELKDQIDLQRTKPVVGNISPFFFHQRKQHAVSRILS